MSFLNEYALRFNLVHFNTILRKKMLKKKKKIEKKMLQCALSLSHLDDFSDIVTYCNDNNIFFWGGGKLGILGGSFYPSKTLHGTLDN